MTARDPHRLLRHPGPVDAYPLEPSTADLAASVGRHADEIVRYDMNTLGGGPLPGLREAWRDWDPAAVVEYGDLGYGRLREALGHLAGVDARRIIPGAGADELIRLITTSVVGSGDAVVVPTPTFPMFAVEAGLAGARVVPVQRSHLAQPQAIDVIREAVERDAARLVWVCSPNNPTGDAHPVDAIRELADGLEAIVAVDQVYLDFAEADGARGLDAISIQADHDNVLVLRSLAKAYGLAGARIGYLVVPAALAQRFDALRLPLSVGLATETLALGVLADPRSSHERLVSIMVERRRLEGVLRELGCVVLGPLANFVTFRPPDAASLADALLDRGLVLRAYDAGPMRGWLRATALDREANERLIAALRELLG
jgi:histidinol-phosphate aminotransferase